MTWTPIPFVEFAARADRLYSTGRHAPKTLYRVRQVLAELAALGPVTTADLTTDLMARYVAGKGPAANPNTLNGQLSTLAALCSYAMEEGWVGRKPSWRRVRPRPGPTVVNAPPTYDQVAALLGHLLDGRDTWTGHRLCALTWTFALTGLRLHEALCAKLVDVDLGDGPRLTVSPRRRLKTEGSAAVVPLPDALAAVLRPWAAVCGGEWLFPGVRLKGAWTGGSDGERSIDHLKRAAAEVGIGHITWHSLRHAFGTYALERWGLPVWVVQRVLRHADPRTTQRYLHLDGSPVVAESVRSICYGPPAAG